ncbi:MAG: nitroreductase family protein [Promethearchaeota archaeon]
MSILGIDYEKCINCKTCIITCPRILFSEGDEDKVIFQDPHNQCNLCGHCIARCTENAILYENIGESYTFEDINALENLVSYENILKLFQAHRSIRRYKKDKVPIVLLQKVFNAMQYAPTARNLRTESYSIMSDREKLKNLSDAVYKEIIENPRTRDLYKNTLPRLKKEFYCPIFFDAPHVIFVASQLAIPIEDNNIGIIITYGRLAAQTLGLGTCWNGLTSTAMQFDPNIMKLANINGKKIGVFTLGYPDVTFFHTAPRLIKKVKGLK